MTEDNKWATEIPYSVTASKGEKEQVEVTVQLEGGVFRSKIYELTRVEGNNIGAGMKIVDAEGRKSVATSSINYDVIEVVNAAREIANGERVIGVSTKRLGEKVESTSTSKEGSFRPKRIQQKTANPKDSELLNKLTLLELTNLAESIDIQLSRARYRPEVVSVLAGDKGLRVVSNAFDGCFKLDELIVYVKERIGPMAKRFKNL